MRLLISVAWKVNESWSPYLSLEDAYKLDDVRDALRRGDLEEAMKRARVFTLTPVRGEIGSEKKPLISASQQKS
jgi:hypothetical protein